MNTLLRAGLFGIITALCNPSFSQEDSTGIDDSLVSYLSSIEVEDYMDKEAALFLSLIDNHPLKIEIAPANKIGYQYMAIVSFPEKPYIDIYLYIRPLKYVNPNGFSKKKKARLVRKEKVEEIRIQNDSHCINGCG